MRKFVISILLGLVAAMLGAAYADNAQENIASSLLRLHIVANSNAEADQSVKLKVRDAVIAELGKDMLVMENLEGAKNFALANIDKIEKLAEKVLCENGLDYSAKASVGEVHFPTKAYENITLPPGSYEALKITLGNGEGENWWCVMYPPLCFDTSAEGCVDTQSQGILKNLLGKSGYELVTGDVGSVPVRFKFKLLEIFDFIGN